MGVLKTERFVLKDLDFKYKIYVDKAGNFSTTLPENIAESMTKCGIRLSSNRLGKLGYIHAKTLKDLEAEVKRLAEDYYSEELIKEEQVIRYSIAIGCSYCKGKDDFVPDGGWASREVGAYEWQNGTYFSAAASPTTTNLSFYAEVKRKCIYKYKNGREFIKYYDIPNAGYRTKEDEDYNKMFIACLRSQVPPRSGGLQEIPATEENCAFFVGMYKYIFYVNENIKKFLEPDKLQELIQSKTPLLGR